MSIYDKPSKLTQFRTVDGETKTARVNAIVVLEDIDGEGNYGVILRGDIHMISHEEAERLHKARVAEYKRAPLLGLTGTVTGALNGGER